MADNPTIGEKCDRLRWSFYEMPDAIISLIERGTFEKLFPGVPLFEDEPRDDYDYNSAEYRAAFHIFNSIADRTAEHRALKAAFDDAVRTLEQIYQPAFEVMLIKAREAYSAQSKQA